nr:MAG TPA: hypothetical protein [Caudoviricetes sp.]
MRTTNNRVVLFVSFNEKRNYTSLLGSSPNMKRSIEDYEQPRSPFC